ncbi:MAG: DUF2207 domain-containing protein [Acidimicrobiales bacterium]
MRVALMAVIVLIVGLCDLRPAGAQTGGESIASFDSRIQIERDGTLVVTESITYDFGSSSGKHGIFREIPTGFAYDDVKKGYDRVTPFDARSVTIDGGPVPSEEDQKGSEVVLKIGDPDRTVSGVRTYQIAYTLSRALNHFPDHDELYLNINGNGWDVPIAEATGTVSVPGEVSQVACFAGPAGSSLPCTESGRGDGGSATFSEQALGPGEGLTVVVGFPVGVVQPTPTPQLDKRWSPAEAFALRPDTMIPAGGLTAAAIGGFVFLLTRVGRDRRFAGSAVDASFGNVDGASELAPLRESDPIPVEFIPPDKIRPGQVGTLIDEQANTLDVTATIIDLAVRGYLRITEIPKDGWLGQADWQLDSLKPGSDLKSYENTLLTAVFAGGPSVKMSELKNHFATHLKAVENELYDDLVANGWYRHRPDRTRGGAGCLAAVVLVAGIGLTVLLAATTSYGLLGLPLVVLGLLLIFANRAFPARTPKGYATLRRVKGFKTFIDESEKERARFAEQQNLFSEYLPYAIVFGAVDKWARAFAGLDGQLPSTGWYVSPYAFNAITFGVAMNSFTVNTAGTISSVPASSGGSGFSGGFSGGGVGGGGGGSW